MKIIALQEYTDNKVSLYEGEIRNIENNLAQKLIAEGIVAEHSDGSQKSQKNLTITKFGPYGSLLLVDKDDPSLSSLSYSDYLNIERQFECNVQYLGANCAKKTTLSNKGYTLFYFLYFKAKDNNYLQYQPCTTTIKFSESDNSLTIIKDIFLSPSTFTVKFDYNDNYKPNYTFAQVKDAWDAGQTIIFDLRDENGYAGSLGGGVAYYLDGDGDPNYFYYKNTVDERTQSIKFSENNKVLVSL